MIHRINIRPKAQFGDPQAAGVFSQIKELGIATVATVRSARLFFLYGELSADDARKVAQDLLINPVVEDFDLQLTIDNCQLKNGGAASSPEEPSE